MKKFVFVNNMLGKKFSPGELPAISQTGSEAVDPGKSFYQVTCNNKKDSRSIVKMALLTQKIIKMKRLLGTNLKRKNNIATESLFRFLKGGLSLFCLLIVSLLMLLSSCNKQHPDVKAKDPVVKDDAVMLNSDEEFSNAYKKDIENSGNKSGVSQGFSWTTFFELLRARIATAKYQDFDQAVKDKYADINVVMPNMGYHFMKSKIVDSTFQINKPELLVYNKKRNGKFELVAIEYGVPIDITPDKAPEGFTGSADVWDRNTDFGLWLLHAWVYQFNPDGVFNPTNPTVHVRQ